ncbi:MAG TPA: four helix bundle protein [Phycisphaerae bacterium]|nr:four helix bundle protein [Phycisphaerae bacterium]
MKGHVMRDRRQMTIPRANERGAGPAEKVVWEKPPYDLLERTARFGEAVLRFAMTLPRNVVTSPLIVQLVKAGTSVGSNYGEADEASSKKDFRHRITIARREARESKYWLRMVVVPCPDRRDEAAVLWDEAHQLHKIFSRIVHTCDGKPRPGEARSR